jgi:Domain of unknown function (DUF4115)
LNSGEDGEECEVLVLRRFGLGLLVVLVLALLVLNVLSFSGALVDDETATPTVPAEPAPPPAESDLARPPDRNRDKQIARRQPERPRPRSVGPTLILSATRGDCWVEVRAGSATGQALFAGTLTTGRSLRFNRPKLWLRLGAASNVDIVVNGRPSAVPPGTVELTVPDA